MSCQECKTKEAPVEWQHSIYSLDGTPKDSKIFYFCSKLCREKFLSARAKWFDDLDEVMNRNKYFVRTKGMEGNYVVGDKSFPVSAFWKRGDIEYDYSKAPIKLKNQRIQDFQNWLKDNNLKYEYISR